MYSLFIDDIGIGESVAKGTSHMPLVRVCTIFLEDRYIKIFKICDFFKV